MARRCTPALLLLTGFLVLASASRAQIATLGPVTIGAGLRTDFTHTEPDTGKSTDQFSVDDIRLYVNGSVTENIKFMFNTDYNSATNNMGILDAVAEFSFGPHVNIWAGRFLPPSDRANLYGPFYAHAWKVYTDGIQDGYPFVFQGRDNGVVWWGDFAKKVKVSVGGFDGGSAGTGRTQVIGAARVQVDFWDPEEGYYLNGTYYGDKNLLAIGAASQLQDGNTASTIDFLLEKKVLNGGAFTIESEYSNYNRLGGYNAAYAKSQGEYGLGSFLFPKVVPIGKLNGKFEILGKYAKAQFTQGLGTPNYDQKTTEVNFNYVIKQFNARVQTFFEDTKYNRLKTDTWQAGIGLQIQM
jgi:hypothetical protein